MDQTHLDELISIEQTYWWHIAKKELLIELLKRECPIPARVLEGGVGGGNNLLTLKELGYNVSGLDKMQTAVDHCHSIGLNDVQLHDLEQAWPIGQNIYDAVVLLDVIEHCQNPSQVLRYAEQSLCQGGKIIITVPAIPSFMGPWDRALGHQRRYTIDMLRKNAQEAALKLNWYSYWNSFSILPAIVVRSFERFFIASRQAEFPRLPVVVNKMLIHLAKMEREAICKVPIPLGLSLIGVMTR